MGLESCFQMWTNAVLLSPCVILMPIVRTLVDPTSVSAKPDLLEMEKLAPVNSSVAVFSNLTFTKVKMRQVHVPKKLSRNRIKLSLPYCWKFCQLHVKNLLN